jgi:hypothetical protein
MQGSLLRLVQITVPAHINFMRKAKVKLNYQLTAHENLQRQNLTNPFNAIGYSIDLISSRSAASFPNS